MEIPRFRQQSLHSWSRRAGTILRRSVLNRFVRHMRVRKITINGRAYKRVTCPDTFFAQQVASNLVALRGFEILPRLIAREDRDLLLEFVEGHPLPEPPTSDYVDRMAEFFATLYGVHARVVALEQTPFAVRLRDDLEFLRDAGVIGEEVYRDVLATSARVAPAEVRIGYDYLDSLPKNFIVRPDGHLMAIDVEDLASDELIGTGLAKALLRGLGPQRQVLLDGFAKHAGFDLKPSMPFVELAFLARWTKHAFLKGRPKLVEPEHFERHRSGS